MRPKYAIGIDIGGTKISSVLGNGRGAVLSSKTIPTQTRRNTRKCLAGLKKCVSDLIAACPGGRKNILGIGVGLPGAVDPVRGAVPRSPNLSGWTGVPLRKMLESEFRLPVRMANDANAAVLAEKIFGAGRGVQNLIYITVSTGVGGGIVAGGALIEGARHVAGEIGHMTVVPGGEPCKCGKNGCLEAYASGTAIGAYARSEIRKGRKSGIASLAGGTDKIRALHVAMAAKLGDRLACETFKRAGYYLGIGIGNLLNVLNPERIVLGGGVFKSVPPVFWSALRKACRETGWPEARRGVRIAKTRLGRLIGGLGALALVFEKQG